MFRQSNAILHLVIKHLRPQVFIIGYSAGAYLAYCRIIGIVTLHLFSGSFRLDFLEEPTQRHAARF